MVQTCLVISIRAARILMATRAARGFGDGIVAVTLASYLSEIGLSGKSIGVLLTAMLLGSAAMTLWMGASLSHLPRRMLLLAGAGLMVLTGVVFGTTRSFAVLLVASLVGTINPTSGDVSILQPLEQALLPRTTRPETRTETFAKYTFGGACAGAFGLACAGIPALLGAPTAAAFFVYAACGALAFVLYRALGPEMEAHGSERPMPLGPSRAIVLRLAALFSLDSFAGGFATQALIALWLFRKFGFALSHAGAVMAGMGVLSAASGFLAVRIERRLGAVRTMAFTHLPAQVFLILAVFAPTATWATVFLLLRSALASMDVPVRNAFVMNVVTPAERTAAASFTNVPRSLASAVPPFIAGWMLDQSAFGWPLVVAGALKIAYDLLLLILIGHGRRD